MHINTNAKILFIIHTENVHIQPRKTICSHFLFLSRHFKQSALISKTLTNAPRAWDPRAETNSRHWPDVLSSRGAGCHDCKSIGDFGPWFHSCESTGAFGPLLLPSFLDEIVTQAINLRIDCKNHPRSLMKLSCCQWDAND